MNSSRSITFTIFGRFGSGLVPIGRQEPGELVELHARSLEAPVRAKA